MFKVITILMSILFLCCYEDNSNDYIDYLPTALTHPRFGLHGRSRARTVCRTPSPHIEILGEECLPLNRRHSF